MLTKHNLLKNKIKTFKVDLFKDINKEVISKYNILTKYSFKDKIYAVLENVLYRQYKDTKKRKTSLTNETKNMGEGTKYKKIQKMLELTNYN